MILPNETGYLPIIVGETVLAFACYRVYRQAWAAPEYSSSGVEPSPGKNRTVRERYTRQ